MIHRVALLNFVVALITSERGFAGIRFDREDPEIVARSELIVVARLEPNSIEFIPREVTWWEHSASLRVTEVLKGQCKEASIPIVIHYGLTPAKGGRWQRPGGKMFDYNWLRSTPFPADAIIIADTGNSACCVTLDLDAAQENLWFLRRLGGELGREPDPKSKLGVLDPEDIQPLRFREYLLCYLSKEPTLCVREQMQRLPEIATRATRYLAFRELQRIAASDDPLVRVERALPYWMDAKYGKVSFAAEKILADAGPVAGAYLMSVFRDESHPELRERVIEVWAKLRYQGCVDSLIALLKGHDEFWKEQHLEKNWWNSDVDSELTRVRRDRSGEDYRAVRALGLIGDVRAREVVQQARRRWLEAGMEANSQPVEACDEALRAFEKVNR